MSALSQLFYRFFVALTVYFCHHYTPLQAVFAGDDALLSESFAKQQRINANPALLHMH